MLATFVVAALLLGSEAPVVRTPAPLVGFSFSPLTSMQADRDPAQDLRRLLDATSPDLVRLPVYWNLVQPTPTRLDFTSVDTLIDAIADFNKRTGSNTRVVLTVGARNFLYPELHQPRWAGKRTQPFIGLAQEGLGYRRYFEASISRYRDSPLLYAWQVENEPLDSVVNDRTGEDAISEAQLDWEVGEVRRLDPSHDIVITTYNALTSTADLMQVYTPWLTPVIGGGSGHPDEALEAGDALGLDLYLDSPHIAARDYTSVALRAKWKQQALAFWSDRAHAQGKQVWVNEVQAQPWNGETSFSPGDLIASAVDYREEHLDVALLWGVETWLESDEWMAAGQHAMQILRAP